jgi:hypothetical protein
MTTLSKNECIFLLAGPHSVFRYLELLDPKVLVLSNMRPSCLRIDSMINVSTPLQTMLPILINLIDHLLIVVNYNYKPSTKHE